MKMTMNRVNLKQVLIPTDIFTFLIILAGLFIAIFLSDLAIKLIGVSVAIIGGIAGYMSISQRISDSVQERPGMKSAASPSPDYKMTVKKDDKAKSTIIENFKPTLEAGNEPKAAKAVEMTHETIPIKVRDEAAPAVEDDGFTIIAKTAAVNQVNKIESEKAEEKAEEISEDIDDKKFENEAAMQIAQSQKEKAASLDYDDGFSGMRIIKKTENIEFKKEVKPTRVNTVPALSAASVKITAKAAEAPITQKEEKEQDTTVKEQEIHQKPIVPDLSMLSLTEEIPVFGEDARKEFEYFINRSLSIIRTVAPAQTIAFFLVNLEKQELILESYITDCPDAIIKDKKLKIKNDIISRIVQTSKPEILTEINPAAVPDLLPYYTRQTGSSSFIGIPVFYEKSVIGIICADSKMHDIYDAHTVNFFGQFTLLLAALVRSYTEKYDLLQESRTLKALNILRENSQRKNINNDEIALAVLTAMKELFEFTAAGFCSYDETEKSWIVNAVAAKDERLSEDLSNAAIDMSNTLIGVCVRRKQTISVAPFKDKYIRYSLKEPSITGGYFVCAPLMTANEVYGAVFMEGLNVSNLTGFDIDILEKLAQRAADSLEHIHIMNILKSAHLKDSETGLLNSNAFFNRLHEETAKANDLGTSAELALFAIDKYSALDPDKYPDRIEKAYEHVLDSIRNNLNAYDVFGKIGEDIFAALLINEKPERCKIRTDKIRNEIASKTLISDGQKFNVTISCGLSYLNAALNAEQAFENAHKALETSASQTNVVTSFD